MHTNTHIHKILKQKKGKKSSVKCSEGKRVGPRKMKIENEKRETEREPEEFGCRLERMVTRHRIESIF